MSAPLVEAFVAALSPKALRAYQAPREMVPDGKAGRTRWLASWVTLAVVRRDVTAGFDEAALGRELAEHYSAGVVTGHLETSVLGPPEIVRLVPICRGCGLAFGRTGTLAPEAAHQRCRPRALSARCAATLYPRTRRSVADLRAAGLPAFEEWESWG